MNKSESGTIDALVVPVHEFVDGCGYLLLPRDVEACSALPEDVLPLKQLRDELAEQSVNLRICSGRAEAVILLRRDRRLSHPEQYRLTIDNDGIDITSATAAGAYYAVQTLRDLLRRHGRRLPCCRIDDRPTFARRGVYLDCARGKVPSVHTVKQLIDWLAHWKVNELQLYIENAFQFCRHPDIGRGYSPFSAEDIREIQGHAKSRHVRFVPSLTSFGHFEKILALPAYRHLGECPGTRGMPGGTTLYPGDPASLRLVRDMYEEFVPLFEAEDFNVCADEPWGLGEGRSKRRASRVGVGRVYLDFVLKLRELCHRHGKRMNMWADIVLNYPEVLDELPRDVVLLNWDYTTGGRRISRTCELRELGLPFVCCPGTSSWVSHGTRLGMSLKNVSMFAREAAKHGAEGLLNTDWGNVGHRHFLADSLCSFTHGAAHGWCTEKVDDQTHVRRFCELAFGDPEGELADAVTTLGEYPLGLNQPYLALYERLTEPRPVKVGRLLDGFCVENLMCINALEASDEEVSRRREKVAGIRWPKPSRNLTGLEKLVPDEFKASAELEALACDRILLARRVRSGKTPTGRSLRQHADALCRAGDTFGLLWRARNRPSRLADHLAAFRSAGEEAKTLASNAKRRSPHAGS